MNMPTATFTCRGSAALQRLLDDQTIVTVLDVGAGAGEQAGIMRNNGLSVFTVNLEAPANYVGDFMDFWDGEGFDAVWACHVLEHQPNVGTFLTKCRAHLKPGGWLYVTVPPGKAEIVGGHLTLWNAGLLCYNLILAGFDCSKARVSAPYASGPSFIPYNISVIVQRPETPLQLPRLKMDKGDIETLAAWFPLPVAQGFNGNLPDINW